MGTSPEPVHDLVTAVRDLLGALPRPPERLSVQAGDVNVEVVWPHLDGHTAGPALAPEDASVPAPAAGADGAAPGAWHVTAPSVGVFYRAPEPGAAPFVAPDDAVRPGQQVAIVEAMKLMLPVEADRPGRVGAVLKEDGEPVEYGEPLFEMLPAAD